MHVEHLPGSFYGPTTLVELLHHQALHKPNKVAFIYLRDGESDEIKLTYQQLDQKARAIAVTLQEKNLAGQRALLLYPAGLDFIAAFFGCMYAGVIAVTAYPPRRNRNMSRIEAIAEDADARIALTTQESHERVKSFITENTILMQIDWLATDLLQENVANQWQEPAVTGENLALLQYTSGSTGTPKGVMISHGNLTHNSAMINYAFEPARNTCGVGWLPSYHDMGLVGSILQPIYCGETSILMSPAAFLQRPYRWLQAITHYRAGISGGPNFAYDLCVDKISDEEAANLDLSSWTLAFNGAEPVRNDTLDRFANRFAPYGFKKDSFYPCYGLAEATLIVSGGLKSVPPVVRSFEIEALENHEVVDTTSDEDDARELVGSGGNLSDQKILIVDPQTHRQCPPNTVGEIWVSGPSIAQGYWKRLEETKDTFQAFLEGSGEGPFLRTGDLGFMLDGELFVTGRLKDLIIIRGVNYYPQDIELSVDRCHVHVRRNSGAAFTIGEDGREQLVVVQEVQRLRNMDTEEVIEAIRSTIAKEHELPVKAIVLIKAGSIPKTSSGKIQRHACRLGYLENTLKVVDAWDSHATEVAKDRKARKPAIQRVYDVKPSTAKAVLEEVSRVGGTRIAEPSLDTNIVEIGLDSLERMEIAATLEERFGGRFPEAVLNEIETCGEVAEAIERHIGDTPRDRSIFDKNVEIPEEVYQFEQWPEIQQLEMMISAVDASGMKNPYFAVHEGKINDKTTVEGQDLINFSTFNYHGLASEPRVLQAAKDAIDMYGTSVGASRLVAGEKTVHVELDRALANFVGTEDAISFVAGHGTNNTVIGHLFGPGDLILHDNLAHNSIVQGAIQSGARRRPFAHNDWEACEYLLKQFRFDYRRVIIALEGVYSMDGDYPDLPKFLEIKRKHKTLLLVDEAHSVTTMGPHGRGISEHFDTDPREIDINMGTISKGLASTGGYIAANKALVRYLRYTAPGFVFATGLSPAAAAAALEAIRILEEEPERMARLHANSELLLTLAKQRGMNTGYSNDTPIVPVIIGNSLDCLRISNALTERGLSILPILHPAVEETASRLRFFVNACHTEEQIRHAMETTAEEVAKVNKNYLSGTTSYNGATKSPSGSKKIQTS